MPAGVIIVMLGITSSLPANLAHAEPARPVLLPKASSPTAAYPPSLVPPANVATPPATEPAAPPAPGPGQSAGSSSNGLQQPGSASVQASPIPPAPAGGVPPPPGSPGYSTQEIPRAPPPPQGYAPANGYPPPYAPAWSYPPVCPPPPPCPCQVSPAGPGARAHEGDGVYLRLQLGVAFAGVSAKSSTTHLEFAGTGGTLGVALGKTVRPNLALFGTFSLSSAVDPSWKRNGVDAPPIAGSTDQIMFGVGIAYYLQPANVFVAASAGISKLDFQDNQNVVLYESKWGGGGELLAGKEWWVSDQWGLGVSGQLSLAVARGKGALSTGESIPTWTGAAFSILFSSTYN